MSWNKLPYVLQTMSETGEHNAQRNLLSIKVSEPFNKTDFEKQNLRRTKEYTWSY